MKIEEIITCPEAKIALCENDARIIEAANKLHKEGKIQPIIVGNKQEFIKGGLNEQIQVEEIQPQKYLERYMELRAHKEITQEEALKQLSHPAQYSAMMVEAGDAHGLVCGATWPTATTIRAALRVLKQDLAYSYFIMNTEKGLYLFGDCAFNIDPSSEELAKIGAGIARQAEKLGLKPKVAMLSFSTYGSANHPQQEKIANATKQLKQIAKDTWKVAGEIQVDAAMSKEVAEHKAPESPVQGDANIFVFPDLNAANIGYKLVQRFTGCEAIGPIISGLKKPVNDLSRGCTSEEIINVCKTTAWQSQQ